MSKMLSLALGFSLAINHIFPQAIPVKAEEAPPAQEELPPKPILDESGKYIIEGNSLKVLKPEFVEIQEEPKPEPPKMVVQKPVANKVAAPTPIGGNVEQWRSLVAKYFPASQVDNALRIMACESKGNPNSVSRTNDHGLMQIHNGLAIYGQKIYNPDFNISLAYSQYYAKRGWSPWSCSKKIRLN